jgi:hypothetical protein
MHEKFLAFVWKHRRFSMEQLCTTDGQILEILYPGDLNTDAGPDFSQARIRIAETLWAGNIELHVKASDWLRHKHSTDAAYDSTVLHVVYEADTEILNSRNANIPCLELKDRIDASVYARFLALETESSQIPCASSLHTVPVIIWRNWLDRLLIERLETKSERILQVVTQADYHWNEAFYQILARSFGQKVNAEAFEQLARITPAHLLAKHKDQLVQVEALLFGQAGFLENQFSDAWPESLRKEYHFLRHKYQLTPMQASQWKFFRLRPAGFPTIRIAQLAKLIHQSVHLFSKLMEAESLRELQHLLHAEVSEYWQTHYQPDGKATRSTQKPMTKELIGLVIYNTVLPFWFVYGRERHLPHLEQKALDFFDALPSEKNHLLDEWKEIGKSARNAAEAQSLLQLRTQYCDRKRCTECAVGMQLLR